MRLISIVLFFFVIVGCKKDKDEPVEVPSVLSNGAVVLCEGLFQQNNSTLSWLNFALGNVSNEFFMSKASRQLGDTGNDIKRYGNKVYVVVNNSSTIEVMDATTLLPIQQILMVNGGTSKQPRNIAFYQDKAYVTCYDGYVDVIDTASLDVVLRIPVGSNPEDLTISNNKLFVSNSGGLNTPMDSTISIIDLGTNTESTKLKVGLNPGQLITDAQGEVYVISRGDYGAVPTKLIRVDPNNDVVLQSFSIEVSTIAKMNSNFLMAHYNYSSAQSNVALFDPVNEAVVNSNYLNLSNVTTLYGINFHAPSNTIYVMDAMSFTNLGYVRSYSPSGSNIGNYHVGLNPSKILFYD